ncbi:MAG: hypothetical protein A3I71_04485 [Omnitrophica WOR_2 bacterium RIFCSPLOWO2_02_FULL_63_16]|nr:MAG: hypothetical protein A3I71_04485 [Omnitrophica WOR_2 bacterium RIFCSPLOWO2_02_FULL_63_16]OGX50236.1 MAG: hypothetical protein A3G88_05495 [Omnitrophica WOR_2 bacterium RIFCSPLOWO2_12_FULL_63_16]
MSQGYCTHDRRFLEQFMAQEYQVWFLPCAVDRVRYEQRAVPEGVRGLPPLIAAPFPWGARDWLRALWRFGQRLREIKPDLVQAGTVQTGGALAAAWGCAPLMVMSWGSDVLTVPGRGFWMRRITQFTLRRAHMVLGDCRAVRDAVKALSGLDDDQIVWFPWGVELDRFRPKPSALGLRRRLNWQEACVLVSTRGFEAIHAPMLLAKAMRNVMQARGDVRVIMLGEGALRPQVERFVVEHGLADRCLFPGQVCHDELADYFNEADLYVSATQSDGSSISLLEAMACGLPVVVADAYGNREWVSHGQHGWMYPAGDSQAFEAAIRDAVDQRHLWEAMGRANVAVTSRRADWRESVRSLTAAHRRLLAGWSGRNGDGRPTNW